MGIMNKVKNSDIAKKATKKANEYMNPKDKNKNKESKTEKNPVSKKK